MPRRPHPNATNHSGGICCVHSERKRDDRQRHGRSGDGRLGLLLECHGGKEDAGKRFRPMLGIKIQHLPQCLPRASLRISPLRPGPLSSLISAHGFGYSKYNFPFRTTRKSMPELSMSTTRYDLPGSMPAPFLAQCPDERKRAGLEPYRDKSRRVERLDHSIHDRLVHKRRGDLRA